MTEEEYMNYQIMMIAEQESHRVDNPGAYKNNSQGVHNPGIKIHDQDVPDSEMQEDE